MKKAQQAKGSIGLALTAALITLKGMAGEAMRAPLQPITGPRILECMEPYTGPKQYFLRSQKVSEEEWYNHQPAGEKHGT